MLAVYLCGLALGGVIGSCFMLEIARIGYLRSLHDIGEWTDRRHPL